MKPLAPKQARFADEYLIDLNATQAAIRAGYSAKTARQIGSRLLTKVDIQTAVAKRQARIAERAGLTLERHLDALNDLRDRAADAEQFGPAVSAEISRGKVSGFYVDRQEHRFPDLPRYQAVNRVAALLSEAKARKSSNGNGVHASNGNGTHR